MTDSVPAPTQAATQLPQRPGSIPQTMYKYDLGSVVSTFSHHNDRVTLIRRCLIIDSPDTISRASQMQLNATA